MGRLQEALGLLWQTVGEIIKLGGVRGFFFGVWVPVPAPWWQWSLGDGFAQCLAGVNAPLKINSAEGGGTSSAGCHKLLTLADASWLFNILVAKTGSFHERPEST